MAAKGLAARLLVLASVASVASAAAAGCGEPAAPAASADAPADAPTAGAPHASDTAGPTLGSRGRRERLQAALEDTWERFLAMVEEGREDEALRLLAYLREHAPGFLDDPEKAAAVDLLLAALVDRVRTGKDPEALAAAFGKHVGEADAARLAAVAAAEAKARADRADPTRSALARHIERFQQSGAARRKPTWVDNRLDALAKTPPAFKTPAKPLPVPDPEETEKRRGRQLVKLEERKVVPLLDHIHGALAWLALHQGPDGAFSAQRAAARCKELGHKPCTKGKDYPLATTALAVLAFLDFRDQDARGVFEPALANGVRWLTSQQDKKTGRIKGRYAYSTPIAVMALGQAAASSHREDVIAAAKRGLEYLYGTRGADGGYRYAPRNLGDVSVTGWVGQALEAVELAGIESPQGMRTSLFDFHDSVWDGDERFKYTAHGGKRASLYPAGMLLRLVLDPEIATATRASWTKYLAKPPKAGNNATDVLYHHYYAVRVLLALDGNLPDAWRERLMTMAGTQVSKGDAAGMWKRSARTRWFSRGGDVLVTAVYALTLEHALYRR